MPRRQQVLEIVEQKEQPTSPEKRLQLLEWRLPSMLAELELIRDRMADKCRVRDCTQRNEASSVAEFAGKIRHHP
jgi:hypothetical protein